MVSFLYYIRYIMNKWMLQPKELKSNIKTDFIQWAKQEFVSIEYNISRLNDLKNIQTNTLKNIHQAIADNNNKLQEMEIAVIAAGQKIREILSATDIKNNTTLDEQRSLIKDIKSEMEKIYYNNKILNNDIGKIELNIQSINAEVAIEEGEKHNLIYEYTVDQWKEVNRNLILKDLSTYPKEVEELILSYKNPNIPKELLDKIIFFKWPENQGKHSVIQAIWNELNRPVFTIKHEDYMSDEWLEYIFNTLVEYLRIQRNIKNEQIEYHNKVLEDFNKINNGQFSAKTLYNIYDILWVEHEVDLWTIKWKKEALKIIQNVLIEIKNEIDKIEDSCILYIDDLDRIVESTKYDKWELLEPIKSIIRKIKTEDHNVLLILVWDKLWTNHSNFKHQIDTVFKFEWLGDKQQDVFQKIIAKYCDKFGIKNKFKNINIDKLPIEYKNIKELDRLVKKIIKDFIDSKQTITQEEFDKIIINFVDWKKYLFNWVGLKQ